MDEAFSKLIPKGCKNMPCPYFTDGDELGRIYNLKRKTDYSVKWKLHYWRVQKRREPSLQETHFQWSNWTGAGLGATHFDIRQRQEKLKLEPALDKEKYDCQHRRRLPRLWSASGHHCCSGFSLRSQIKKRNHQNTYFGRRSRHSIKVFKQNHQKRWNRQRRNFGGNTQNRHVIIRFGSRKRHKVRNKRRPEVHWGESVI